jgi:ribosomal protein S6
MKEIYNLVGIVEIGKKGEEKKKKVKELIKKQADFLFEKEIGEQEFTYEIDEHNKGFYFWVDFNADSDELKKIRTKLKSIDLIRFLISKKPVEAVKRQKEEVEESLEEKEASKTSKTAEKKSKKAKTKKEKKEKTKTTDNKEKKVEDEKKRMEDLDEKLQELL